MSDDLRRLTTEEQRERLYAARYVGGICAVCGKALAADEVVYWERFVVGRVGGLINRPEAPVGSECASPAALKEAEGQPPEPCAGCGRPVRHRRPHRGRRFAVCCKRCGMRASRARRSAGGG